MARTKTKPVLPPKKRAVKTLKNKHVTFAKGTKAPGSLKKSAGSSPPPPPPARKAKISKPKKKKYTSLNSKLKALYAHEAIVANADA